MARAGTGPPRFLNMVLDLEAEPLFKVRDHRRFNESVPVIDIERFIGGRYIWALRRRIFFAATAGDRQSDG
jgi:hypothetical protein